ncbi:hypothetical protein O181_045615 [Austropuccinia psidii MF-1]|uniref:Uncharacterized protein n=1 Tax=Austropuccinia psidii MF-1 TaxID=1389203 RepID=A0A9Q3HLD3_9BASI|nr:hypothetical protein [Austropuccinia psidii MF-1]
MKIQGLQSDISSLLRRSHVAILDHWFPMSQDISGVRRMDLLGRSSKFLRPLLLMVLQGILIGNLFQLRIWISRINTEGLVKRIKQIANSPPDLDAAGGNHLDGEEAEVVYNSIGHQSSTSPSHPAAKRFQSNIFPSTPRTFQPTLATLPTSLPPASPSSSAARPALIPAVRPSPSLRPEIPP